MNGKASHFRYKWLRNKRRRLRKGKKGKFYIGLKNIRVHRKLTNRFRNWFGWKQGRKFHWRFDGSWELFGKLLRFHRTSVHTFEYTIHSFDKVFLAFDEVCVVFDHVFFWVLNNWPNVRCMFCIPGNFFWVFFLLLFVCELKTSLTWYLKGLMKISDVVEDVVFRDLLNCKKKKKKKKKKSRFERFFTLGVMKKLAI